LIFTTHTFYQLLLATNEDEIKKAIGEGLILGRASIADKIPL